jgi:hypothetical protein
MQGVLPNLFKLAPAAGISWFTFEVPCIFQLLSTWELAFNMGACCCKKVVHMRWYDAACCLLDSV